MQRDRRSETQLTLEAATQIDVDVFLVYNTKQKTFSLRTNSGVAVLMMTTRRALAEAGLDAQTLTHSLTYRPSHPHPRPQRLL